MNNSTKKTILYVITQAEWGGAQRYLFDLITSPEAESHDIQIITGASPDESLLKKLQDRATIYQAKNLVRNPSPINDVAAIFELKELFNKINPSVIHLNSSKAGVIGSLAFFLWNKKNTCKLIYTVHGWVLNESLNFLAWSFYYWTEKMTALIKDKIICVSEFDRQTAIKHHICPENKLLTIHNGISRPEFLNREEARAQLFAKTAAPSIENPIMIGTIANFYKNKGLPYLIEAIYLLINKYNLPIMGAIIGDGKLRPEIENIIGNYGLQERIILTGRIDNPEKYLKAFDIYACSSIKEGLPYSILEAMSAELPIIATKVGGIPEMIHDQKNGLCVKPKSPEQIAAAIKFIIDNPDSATQFGLQAKNDAENNFSFSRMAKETFSIYK